LYFSSEVLSFGARTCCCGSVSLPLRAIEAILPEKIDNTSAVLICEQRRLRSFAISVVGLVERAVSGAQLAKFRRRSIKIWILVAGGIQKYFGLSFDYSSNSVCAIFYYWFRSGVDVLIEQ
jgi:hypothetical protein